MQKNEVAMMLDGPAGQIEAVLCESALDLVGDNCPYVAVLCHPHPLYGGTMSNKVVSTLARVYRDLGITTLRFNFRGVGGSVGTHDDARGELDDVCAVSEWLMNRYPDSKLLLAGFSFGAAVVASAAERLPVSHLVLVAPPVGRYGFAVGARFPCPITAVIGGQDDVVDRADIEAWTASLASHVDEILLPDATHFFHGQLITLREVLIANLNKTLF